MAGRGTSIRAGKAHVEIWADRSKLVGGLRAAEANVRAFGQKIGAIGRSMTIAGAAIAGPLTIATKYFSSYGDNVAKMAKRTGLSVEAISKLRFVASQTGTEFENLETAFRKMQRSVYDAGRGLSTQTEALSDLGLSFAQLKDLSPEEQFKVLADRLGKLEDATQTAAIAQMLFGRTGTNLIPLFREGAAGIAALEKEAARLGLVMSNEDAKAAEDFTDAMDKVVKAARMMQFQIGAALGKELTRVADALALWIAKSKEWVRVNEGLVVAIGKIAVGAMATGGALMLLGLAIKVLAVPLGVMVAVLKTVALALAVLKTVALVIATPLGIVTAAVVALGAGIVYLSGAGSKAMAWLGEKVKGVSADVGQAMGAVKDAMARGDVGAAARVMWATIGLEWAKGVGELNKLLQELSFAFNKTMEDFEDRTATLWENLKSGGKLMWEDVKAGWTKRNERLAQAYSRWMVGQDVAPDLRERILDREWLSHAQRISAEYRQAVDDILAENQNMNAALETIHRDNLAQMEGRFTDSIQSATTNLAEARKQWELSLAVARGEGAAGGPEGAAAQTPAWVRKMMDGLDEAMGRAEGVRTAGTFTGFALHGFGANQVFTRTATAAEKAVDRLDSIEMRLQMAKGATFQ